LRCAGRAGTGYTLETARTLFRDLQAMRRVDRPVRGPLPPEARKNVVWVDPVRVAEIEFRGWTAIGMLRQAAFKALRDDKDPSEIIREDLGSTHSEETASGLRSNVRLTHPDRLLWPEAGITKQGLADYNASAWGFIEPHITGRPLALVRCPAGIDQGCFFQKHQWEGIDEHVVRIIDPSEEKRLVGIKDYDGLMALVQASVLEIHPWGARIEALDTPDRLFFDLDPGDGIVWSDLVAAAHEVRLRLREDGLESFVKTSGGKGLHVAVPIEPRAGWEEAKDYCRSLAEAMAADNPQKFTATIVKRERTGRIFIDYLRNSRGATAVGAYSTRARPEAGLSMPLEWPELANISGSAHFTLNNVMRRLQILARDKLSDPWSRMSTMFQTLPRK
jgi:bifunctional non-homologous end joining protein LigD